MIVYLMAETKIIISFDELLFVYIYIPQYIYIYNIFINLLYNVTDYGVYSIYKYIYIMRFIFYKLIS